MFDRNRKILDDQDLEAFRLLEIGFRQYLTSSRQSQSIVFDTLEVEKKRDWTVAMAVVYVYPSKRMRVRARFRDGEHAMLRRGDFKLNHTYAGQVNRSPAEEEQEGQEAYYSADVIFEALPESAGWKIVGEMQFFPLSDWPVRHDHKADFFCPPKR